MGPRRHGIAALGVVNVRGGLATCSCVSDVRHSAPEETMPDYPYDTHLNILCGPLERIDVPALVAATTHPWYNQTLCKVDSSVVRLGVVQGDYHWHKHDDEDEFFYVVSGRFLIDLEDRTIDLGPGQGVVIP